MMRVHGKGRDPEGLRHHHARRFMPDPRQGLQRLEALGDLSSVPFQQELGQASDVFGLGFGQSQLANVSKDLRLLKCCHGRRVRAGCKQCWGHLIHFFVRALGAQQHGDQQREWIAVIQRNGVSGYCALSRSITSSARSFFRMGLMRWREARKPLG